MKLLICIAFHFVPNNIQFLKKVLNNIIDNYHCDYHIIVDTNEEETINILASSYRNVEFIVHSNLPHPFELTFMHRYHFLKYMDAYDMVLYSEDDVLIPFLCILDFIEKIKTMWPKYIPCYRRLEWSKKLQEYVALDVFNPQIVDKNNVVHHEGKQYFIPDFPYHAFWMLPTVLLKENLDPVNFVKFITHSPVYNNQRESAASYTLGPGPYHAHNGQYKNTYFLNKIPLFEINYNEISAKCYVYHTPNKYADIKIGTTGLDATPIKKYLCLKNST